jgi:ribonuclease E
MTMRMLIDASHSEETRVAVVKGSRIEDFDFESAARQQIKGNIYLAKVARVEPSLQAAFIEYGGNRHGFLAFSEIHPDYYQIPREDRERLLREEQAIAEEAEAAVQSGDEGDAGDAGEGSERNGDGEDERAGPMADTQSPDEAIADRLRRRRMELRRRYKIQDVIKRRQVLLVQVVKEERGNKGAALTTYLSLAGRYCVLMPNTSHGGGISRKISSAADRKRLKAIIDEMALPPGMAAIVRTAGLSRTRTEIRRDFDYLTRLWDEIRETTLASTAPALIHEDSNLIKRAIRDIYSREIDEVLVEGEHGYQAARAFMKLLMPSHAKRVKLYAEPVPLFQRSGVEPQLDALFQPTVQLPSGGYMVLNPTEALVSVDINSGRATREHNIEETALRTNLEAAEEVARQLRLRDLAGLVVIDFIDMESNSNVRKVERALKKALEADRARIQVGRISGFGLLEMSRQRLRSSLIEASTEVCPHCDGIGLVRTAASSALAAIRALEAEALRGRGSDLTLTTGIEVAAYLFNRKRDEIAALEARYGVRVAILPDPRPSLRDFSIQASGVPGARITVAPLPAPVRAAMAEVGEDADDVEEEVDDAPDHADEELDAGADARPRGDQGRRARGRGQGDAQGRDRRDGRRDDAPASARPDVAGEESAEGAAGPRKRRRRRRRGRGRDAGLNGATDAVMNGGAPADTGSDTAEGDRVGEDGADAPEAGPFGAGEDGAAPVAAAADAPDGPARKGRGRRRKAAPADTAVEALAAPADDQAPDAGSASADTDEAPAKARAPRRRKASVAADAAPPVDAAPSSEAVEEAPQPAPRRGRRKAAAAEAERATDTPAAVAAAPAGPVQKSPAPVEQAAPPVLAAPVVAASAAPAQADAADRTAEPPRTGWWRRTFGV